MISQRLAATLLILAAAESIPINVDPSSYQHSPKLRKARVTEGQGTLENTKSTSNLVSVLQDLRSAWAHQTPLLQLSRAVGIEHQLVDQQDVVLRVSKDNQSIAAASAEVAKATELLNSTRSNLESSRKEALRLADKAHEQATKLWAEAKAADEAEGAAATKARAKIELAKKKKAKLDALAVEAQNEADFFSSGKALTEEQVQELSSNVLPVQEDLTDVEEDTDVLALAEVNATAITNATSVQNATATANATSVQNATGSGNVTEDVTGAGNATEKDSEAQDATDAEDASEAQASDAAANDTEAGNVAAANDATEATNSSEAADTTEDADTSEEATATEDVQETAKDNSTDTSNSSEQETEDSNSGKELN